MGYWMECEDLFLVLVLVARDAVDPRVLVDGDNLVVVFHGLGGELPH